jgi:transcriptional regulator with XRE-family HTH domain
VTTVQHAREALGGRLREVRRSSGLTGRGLAERLGWPPSKVSKLENARQTPSAEDIRGWCAACGAEAETEGLLASLHTLESRHAEWRRMLQGGASGHQSEIATRDAKTRLFRAFETAAIPGLLQTAGYARARFAEGIAAHGLPNDIDAAVAGRLARQQILYDPSKRFHFVITEAVLRFQTCPPQVMLAQLDRLVAATTLPNVRLGVISFETTYVSTPWHGFWLLDEDLVMVETVSAELNLTQPQEIEVYGRVFASQAAVASYGSKARAIIMSVMEQLRAALPGEADGAEGEIGDQP